MHVRTWLRATVAGILDADVTITETVEQARGVDLKHEDLPRILVYTRDDRRVGEGPRTLGPLSVMRETTVVVECVRAWSKQAGTRIDDECDEMAERVEAALAEAQAGHLGNQVQRFLYRETTDALTVSEAKTRMASRVLSFDVMYSSEFAANLPDLVGSSIDYYLGAPGDQPDGPHAEDELPTAP